MANITYIHPDGTTTVLDVSAGTSVMRGAVLNGVNGIVAECGGSGQCGTCHVFIDDDTEVPLSAMHDAEDEVLYCTAVPRRYNSRLSCQLPVSDAIDGLVVHMPETQL